jgi:lysophospholipase L1-like esterase
MPNQENNKTMYIHSFCRFFLVALTLHGASAQEASPPALAPFEDGIRYAALGDSITRNGLYHSYVHLFHATRFPDRAIEFINSGVSGDNAPGALTRLSWDLFPANPKIVSIMFGMNDVGSTLYTPDQQSPDIEAQRKRQIDLFERNLREIVKTLKDAGIRPFLLTPSIYDDTAAMDCPNNPSRNSGLGEAAARVRGVAADFHLPLVDFHSPMLEINLRNQKEDPSFTLTSKDRVHPDAPGHFVMAYHFLKAQEVPGDVAKVSIQAADGTVTAASNCTVEDVHAGPDGVTFQYLANALPFPVDEAAKPALAWVPFTEEMNRETLGVSGLASGSYRLEIDGKLIRTFTSEELAKGVNLALETSTPQYQQALQVLELFKKRWGLVKKLRAIAFVEHGTCREMPRPLTLEQVQPKLEAWIASAKGKPYEGFFRACGTAYLTDKPQENELASQIEGLLPEIRSAAKPHPRSVAISKVGAKQN